MPASDLVESVPKRATTASGTVAWIEAGPEEPADEKAPPLVLIHGFTGHRDDFIGVLPALACLGGGRRVLAPDLRGHGDSDSTKGPLGWSFEQLVNDLLAFLDHLGLERVDLLGHSMGGFVALRFALAHADRLRSLCFLCTGPEMPPTLRREGFLKAADLADQLGIEGLQQVLEKVGRKDMSPTVAAWSEQYWRHHRRRLNAMTPESYRGLGAALFDSESLVPRLSEIDLPSLVMVGEFDHDWLPGAARFEEELPCVASQVLPNAEHHPHIENAEAFLHGIEHHLASLEGRGPDGGK